MRTLSFIHEMFSRFALLMFITIFLQIIVGIIEACSIFTVAPLVDFLINPNPNNASSLTHRIMNILSHFGLPSTMKIYLLFFVGIIFISSGFRILARYSILKTKYAVCRDIMLGTLEDFFSARWYFFSSSKQGMLLNTFIRELDIIGDAFGAMAIFFASCIRLFFSLLVPFIISWQVTSVSLFTALVLVWPFVFLNKIGYKLGKLNTSTANEISTVIHESLSLAKAILGFGNQHKSIKSLSNAYDAHRNATIKSQTLNVSIPILYRPFGVVVLAIALLIGQRFGVSLSEIAVLLLAMLQAVISIGDLAAGKNSLDIFFPSYEQIKYLRDRARQFKQHSGNKIFTGFNKEIKIENVSFAYPGHQPVLIDIFMKIPKGKMIAIVGESGGGKSTLLDTIMGFNEPSSGEITFDGINLREFDIISYRKRIGYVPQDTVLFNMSIRDNLVWANEKATDEDLKFACHLANVDEFITSFPQSYNTLVGDRGVRLSGGQRQRMALARAILRQPELLFLDEATSSLDTHSERLIQQAIEEIAKETTIIVIAHRLSTIVNADYVYVLKKGRVIEEGRYPDLIQLNGHFNNMVNLQLLQPSEK